MTIITVFLSLINFQLAASSDSSYTESTSQKTIFCTVKAQSDHLLLYICNSDKEPRFVLTNLIDFPTVKTSLFPTPDTSFIVTVWENNYLRLIEEETASNSMFSSELSKMIQESFNDFIELSKTEVVLQDSTFLTEDLSNGESLKNHEYGDSIFVDYLEIKFTTKTTYPNQDQAYEIVVDSTFYVFDLEYPMQVLEDHYVSEVLQTVEEKADLNNFIPALETLEKAYSELSKKQFEKIAIDIAERWSEQIRESNEQPDSLINAIENSFISSSYPQWFNEFRIDLFSNYLSEVPLSEDTFQELIDGYDILLNWSDGNDKYLILKNDVQASQALSEDKLWKAIDFLELANEIDAGNQERNNKLRKVLADAINKDFRESFWSNIYKYGKRHFSLFENNFELRFKFTKAVEKNQNYDLLIENQEWLLNNFDRDQTYVERKDLLKSLNSAYQAGMQFEDALETNRRLYLQEKDEEILDLFLINLRARMLLPIYEALNVLVNESSTSDQIENIQDRIVFYQNNYLDAMYTVDRNGNRLSNLYIANDVNIDWSAEIHNRDSEKLFYFDDDSLKAWFILPNDSEAYVIELNIQLSDIEHVQLREIRNNPDVPNNWIELIRNNELRGAVASATVIAALLESISFPPDNRWVMNFATQLMKNKSLSHISLYDDSHSAIINKYDISEELIQSEDWMSSLNREVLYHQILRDQGNGILDMTNSIIQDNVKQGVLKIGFYQIE